MKFIWIIALSIGMLQAMELKIEQVGKYKDGDGYYASLKDGRSIEVNIDQAGKIRCTVTRPYWAGPLCYNEMEEEGDLAWYSCLKDAYEKRQQSTSQEK